MSLKTKLLLFHTKKKELADLSREVKDLALSILEDEDLIVETVLTLNNDLCAIVDHSDDWSGLDPTKNIRFQGLRELDD